MGNPIQLLLPNNNDQLDERIRDATCFKPLRLNDRCDLCGSQAFVAAHPVVASPLLFCGHHFAEFEQKLVNDGWVIQDERDKINPPPSDNTD
jgi:ribosomal protein S27AE